MTRAVYIGGFLNGRYTSEGVGEALRGGYYEDVKVFTFSDAMNRPDDVRRAVDGVHTYTLSAALLALKGTTPEFIHAFNPPKPTKRSALFGRTLVKTAHMAQPGRGIVEPRDIAAVAEFSASSIAEGIRHPRANAKPFLNGTISRTDAIEQLASAREAGIGVQLATAEHDDYFRYTPFDWGRAAFYKVPIICLPGEHDELALRPQQTLANYHSATA